MASGKEYESLPNASAKNNYADLKRTKRADSVSIRLNLETWIHVWNERNPKKYVDRQDAPTLTSQYVASFQISK